ncbi:MAG: LLM class flavin-dependent oxidoreductase [Candidatus Heimdallarchaeota archaeon]|nr:LLM class flavin-dependent oxidoreductase [Candidatus Heimdallarchaeota archaeon]
MTSEIKYGLALIQFKEFADPNIVVEFAVEAEKAGWDGIFLCDHLLFEKDEIQPIAELWVLLGAIAAKTSRIKIGTYVTPLPRYHPWQFAKMAATLDVLSNGRLILGLGIGGPEDEFKAFGETYDTKILAEKLEEEITIIQGLWTGEPFSFSGKHYEVDNVGFLPKPVQSPRIPLIMGGMWPSKKPFVRAAQFDGAMPIHKNFPQDLTPDEIRQIIALINSNRKTEDKFEIIVSGTGFFSPDQHKSMIQSYIDSGITWWLEHVNTLMQPSVEEMRKMVKQGPPRP